MFRFPKEIDSASARPYIQMRATALIVWCVISLACGQAPTTNQDTKLSEDQQRAQKVARHMWKISRIDHHDNEPIQISLMVADEESNLGFLNFRQTHPDFSKVKAVRVGQELTLEYTPFNEDPTWTNGGNGMFTKYIRLVQVR
jgi:hypothetical protein